MNPTGGNQGYYRWIDLNSSITISQGYTDSIKIVQQGIYEITTVDVASTATRTPFPYLKNRHSIVQPNTKLSNNYYWNNIQTIES